jgi:hypothetical protein
VLNESCEQFLGLIHRRVSIKEPPTRKIRQKRENVRNSGLSGLPIVAQVMRI